MSHAGELQLDSGVPVFERRSGVSRPISRRRLHILRPVVNYRTVDVQVRPIMVA